MVSEGDNFDEIEKIAQMSLNKQVDMLVTKPELLLEPAIKEANSTVHSLTVHILSISISKTFEIPSSYYWPVTMSRINRRSFAEMEKSLAFVKTEDGTAKLFPMHELTGKNFLLFNDADEKEARKKIFTAEIPHVDPNSEMIKSTWAPCKTAQLDLATVEVLISAFPALTELIFVNESKRFGQFIDTLVAMLKGNWAPQLTSFTLINVTDCRSLNTKTLFNAVNALPSLKKMYIVLEDVFPLQPLSILSQLETVHFSVHNLKMHCPRHERQPLFKNAFGIFMRSLENYASSGLEVDFPAAHFLYTEEKSRYSTFKRGKKTSKSGRQLISLLASKVRFVRMNCKLDMSRVEFPAAVIASKFPWLTSLLLKTSEKLAAENLSALAPLKYLLHLQLFIDIMPGGKDQKMPLFPPPTVSLPSVKALDLFCICSHYQLEWLNLPLLLPNLEAIYLIFFCCHNCFYDSDGTPWGSQTKRMYNEFRCFQVLSLLRINTHIPDKNIIFSNSKGDYTVEKAEADLLAFQLAQQAQIN